MVETRPQGELPPRESTNRWVGENFAGIGCFFNLSDEFAIQPYFNLNHLLSMATLRKFYHSLEKPFDTNTLSQLRDSVSLFITVGKTSAQHVPLTPKRLQNGDWTYFIGEREYPASEIVPAFHSTGKFIEENIKFLPIGDFRGDFLITRLDEEKKKITTSQRSGGRAAESNIRFLVNNTEQLVSRKFDKCSHNTPWSVMILKEKDKNTYWLEFVVKSSEHYGNSRRAHSAPYIVRLETNPEVMGSFIEELNQNLNSLDEKTAHKLLYFLTAVFYFQSDPDFPYLNSDVQPPMVDSDLPSDLLTMELRVRKMAEAPKIFARALQETDGLKVIESLNNYGNDFYGHPHKNLQEVIAELKEAFGSEYEKLSTKIRSKFETAAKKAEKEIATEIKWQAERSKEFEKELVKLKPEIIQIIQKHFGPNFLDKGQKGTKRIEEITDFDEMASSFEGLFHLPQMELKEVMSELREKLLANAIQSILEDVVSEIREAGTLKKIITKSTLGGSFVVSAEKLIKEAKNKWGLEDIEEILCRENSVYDRKTIRALFNEFSF